MSRRKTRSAASSARLSLAEHLLDWLAGKLAPFLPITYLEGQMSDLSSHLDALEAKITAAETADQQDDAADAAKLADLQKQIDALNAKVTAGTVTPEELARLDALGDRLANLNKPDGAAPAPEPIPGQSTTDTNPPADVPAAPTEG